MTEDATVGAVRRQFEAALHMLISTVELCPEELWVEVGDEPVYWQELFHTLMGTATYLQQEGWPPVNELMAFVTGVPEETLRQDREAAAEAVVPLRRMMEAGYQVTPVVPREKMLAFARGLLEEGRARFARDAGAFDGPEEIFPWTGPTLLDRHIYNTRHVQHHAGRLAARLRRVADVAGEWICYEDRPISDFFDDR